MDADQQPTLPDWRRAWRAACEACEFTDAGLLALARACEARSRVLHFALSFGVFPGRGPELADEKTGDPTGVCLNDAMPYESVDPLAFAALEGRRTTIREANRAYRASYDLFPEPHRSAWFRWSEETPDATVMDGLAALCRAIVAERNPNQEAA